MNSRILTDHKVNGLNEAITAAALDNPGPGGANHHYALTLPNWTRNPDGSNPQNIWELLFQNGPIASAADFNGVTNEAVLAILIDRMRGFQYERNPDGTFNFNSRGKHACRENAQALTYLEEALMWLQKRTRDRMERGVEGTHKV